jgi:peptidoglycan/LPS O-acetylase OafA/YrhL
MTRNQSTNPKKLYVHLEFARGIAALLVLAGHLRAFIFVDYPQIQSPNIIDKLFYFITGLGHQAVMVFFVLSGFLITKSIENMVSGNYWSWKKYLVNRLSRLWTVLIPALFLTFFWDSLGKELSVSTYYLGELKELYNSGPLANDQLSNYYASTFIQNVFFLQTITTPSYGTNGPLWSLAYEFWYYIIFPLGYTFFLFKKHILKSMVTLCFLVIILAQMPNDILLGGVIWLLGYLVGLLEKLTFFRSVFQNRFFLFISFLIFGLSLTAAKIKLATGFGGELIVGASFGLLMLALLHKEVSNTLYIRISDFISNISYTLYLVHFPLLGFICSVVLNNQQFQMDEAVGLYAIIFFVAIIYAFLIYWVFEKNTPAIKKSIWNILNR